jgi:hypothetical protein
MGMWVGAGHRVDVEGTVEQGDPLADEHVGGVGGLGCLVEPAGRRVLTLEGSKGADRGRAGERQGGGLGSPLGLSGPAAAVGRRRRCPERLHDQHALLLAGDSRPGQVAAIGQRQRPGEIELRESE